MKGYVATLWRHLLYPSHYFLNRLRGFRAIDLHKSAPNATPHSAKLTHNPSSVITSHEGLRKITVRQEKSDMITLSD